MGHFCDSCGQELPHEHAAAGTWLQEPDDVTAGAPSATPEAKPSGRIDRRGTEKRVLSGLLAVVALWAAFVGIGRLTSPDQSIDEQAAADIEERAEREAQEEADAERAAQDAEDDYAAADAAPGAPEPGFGEGGEFEDLGGVGGSQRDNFIDGSNLGARTAITVQVERLKRQLGRRDSNAFVAYRSADGVVLIDLAQGSAQEVVVDGELVTPMPGAHVLRSGSLTFGIDPETLAVDLIGSGGGLVVADSRDGATYAVSGIARLGQSAVVDVVSDGVSGSLSQPIGGLQLQPLDGLGLLAVPNGAIGDTLIADSETNSFTVLSENRVLTGTGDAVLEQACSPSEPCTLELVNLTTGERSAIPNSFIRFGDTYSVSPDGGALLRRSPQGFAEMFETDTNAIAWVVGAGMRHPAWGPNSDFVVWLDEIGSPELKIMFADERDWLTIDLRDLGAPPPVSLELIVFAFGAD